MRNEWYFVQSSKICLFFQALSILLYNCDQLILDLFLTLPRSRQTLGETPSSSELGENVGVVLDYYGNLVGLSSEPRSCSETFFLTKKNFFCWDLKFHLGARSWYHRSTREKYEAGGITT